METYYKIGGTQARYEFAEEAGILQWNSVRRQIQIVFWGLQSELDPRPWNANYLRIRISKRNSHFLRDDEVSVCVPCAFSAKVSGISSTFPPIYSSSNTISQNWTHSIPSRLLCLHHEEGAARKKKDWVAFDWERRKYKDGPPVPTCYPGKQNRPGQRSSCPRTCIHRRNVDRTEQVFSESRWKTSELRWRYFTKSTARSVSHKEQDRNRCIGHIVLSPAAGT